MSPHITPLTVSHFNMHLNLKSARLIAMCKRSFIFLGTPGIGPFGFVGTNVPGFPSGHPLGAKWKMTDHGYVIDRAEFQHPMSPHNGKYIVHAKGFSSVKLTILFYKNKVF